MKKQRNYKQEHPSIERARLRRLEATKRMKAAGKAAGEFDGEWLMVRADTMKKSPLYQRPFNQNQAIEIAYFFNWRAFGVLSVARRAYEPGNPLYFMDGQHRLSGAQMAFSDSVEVPCMVYNVASVQEEAHIYNLININRRGLTYADKWTSRAAEGDAFVEAVERLLGEWGLVAAPKRGRFAPEPGEVVAVNTLESMLKKAGEESVRETLGNLHAVFGDNPKAYNEIFLRGVWNFLIRYPNYAVKRLRTILLRGGLDWRPDTRTMLEEGVSMALEIWTAYNHKEPADRRLPPFAMTPKGRQTGHETNRAALEYRRVREQQDH